MLCYGKKLLTHDRITILEAKVKKRFLVLFVLFLALSVITSCRKKEDSTQTGPVVTVAEEKDYERRTFDKDIPTLTVNDDPIVERDTTREENIEERC